MKTLLDRMREFAQKESIYVMLLAFVILVNVLMMVTKEVAKETEKGKIPQAVLEKREAMEKAEELILERQKKVEELLRRRKDLSIVLSLTSLLAMLVILLGLLIDLLLISLKLARKGLNIHTYRPPLVKWGILDVGRVIILFLFFAYVLIIIESFLVELLPFLKNDNMRMMINSSFMDILVVVFVIYFAIFRYKQRLVSLGLTLKNFFKNVFYGLIGYIAAVPVLIMVLFFVFIIVNLTKYVPQRQPVVELFLKEENPTFLIYSSIFASIFGPFIEELFFRAFMYNALKKLTGIFWAVIITSSVFAALHTNVVGFLPIMVLGILLAYLYEKTGTIVSSITVHIIHNLTMVYFVFLVKQLKIF